MAPSLQMFHHNSFPHLQHTRSCLSIRSVHLSATRETSLGQVFNCIHIPALFMPSYIEAPGAYQSGSLLFSTHRRNTLPCYTADKWGHMTKSGLWAIRSSQKGHLLQDGRAPIRLGPSESVWKNLFPHTTKACQAHNMRNKLC